MGKLMMVMVLGALLSACSSGPVRVHGADVSVDDTRIRVYDGHHDRYYDDDYHGGQRGHSCPPGQAKKGRC